MPFPDKNTKTSDITVLQFGNGGIEACASALPVGQAVFGGLAVGGVPSHNKNNNNNESTSSSKAHDSNGHCRFVSFFYCDEGTPTMQKGRASLHKNGMFVGRECGARLLVCWFVVVGSTC